MTLLLRPPRRDPRPLVVRAGEQGLAYTALDAWELRGHGLIATKRTGATTLALRRLVLQVKPTVLVVALGPAPPPRIVRLLATIAQVSRVPLMPLSETTVLALLRGAPSLDEIATQYPEARALIDGDPAHVVRLAVRCLTHLALPSRFYAPRHAPRAQAPMASRGARRSRPSRGPLLAPACSPRG